MLTGTLILLPTVTPHEPVPARARGPAVSAFDTAVNIILGHEGGISDDSDDPGGLTNMGITAGTLESAIQQGLVPPSTTSASLTQDQAKLIYKRFYWDRVAGDKLPRLLALAMFDTAVNQGVPTAIVMLQTALKVTVDGVIGPKTLAAAMRVDAGDTLDALMASRVAAYADLASSRPVMRKFRTGWFRRCFKTARLAVTSETV